MREPGRSQALLAAGGLAAFALSAITDVRVLAAAAVASLVLFRRGAPRALRRVALLVAPPVLLLAAGSWAWLHLLAASEVPVRPFQALVLRTLVIAFVTFSVLDRADVLRALAPFPVASRLLVVTLAQIHALRRLATESAQGLRSRMTRRPRTRDVIRNAGGVSATLLTLATRNARETGEAMRSREI